MSPSVRTSLRHCILSAICCVFAITAPVRARQACAGEWTFAAWPAARSEHHLAYDAARAVSVLFGGRDASGVLLNDTWTWDGTTWREMATAAAPSARTQGAMAYDAARQRVVLFGGQVGGVNNRETWEWDGAAWSLRSTTGPSARFAHTMVYDSAIQRVVVFGGQDSSNLQGDSWSWDGTTGAWTQIPTTITPGQGGVTGHQHASSYDSARSRHVLFSVQGGAVTWERTGNNWSLFSNSAPPAGRAKATMAFVPGLGGNGASVLFGGNGGGSSDTNLWAWNGASWSVAQASSVQGPGPREGHTMAYDSARGVVLMFGGSVPGGGTASANNETWEWSASTGWKQVMVPTPRESHAMAYDAARGEMVLFGGIVSNGGTVSQETWVRSGGRWSRRLTGAPIAMGGRYGHAMSYDERAQRVTLYGGRLQGGGLAGAGMWEWDGAQWTTRSSALTPAARSNSAMVYSRAALGSGRSVLAGGVLSSGAASADSWAWDGVTGEWQAIGALPNPLTAHTMAYDARDGVIVAFGGRTSAGTPPSIAQHRTLYRLDANLLGWTQLLPGAGLWPSPRERHVMLFDGSTNTTVMIGGIADDQNAGALYSDVWEWDNRLQQWTLRTPSGMAPPGIRRHASAADPDRAEIVVFGGSLSANTMSGGIASGRTQSEWVFASPRVSRWKTFAGGSYGNALNWECDRLPGVESAIVVEREGFNPMLPAGTPTWPVNINVTSAPQAARSLDVRWDSVTFNLLQNLSLLAPGDMADPSLIVGGVSNEPSTLRLINTNPSGSATSLTASAGVIGRDAGSSGLMSVSGQRVRLVTTDDVVIGANGAGEVRVEDRAQLMFGGSGTRLSIGESGVGTMRVTGPGARAQSTKGTGISGEIVIGENAGSTGLLSVSAGAAFFADTDDLLVGDGGQGTVEIVGGNALLQTNSFNSAVIGRQAGSNGTLRIDASEWREGVSVPTVGLGGTGVVQISSGAIVGDRGLSLASHGTLRGDGTVVGDVFNLGNVWPDPSLSVGSATRGRIEAHGSYVQIGLPPGAGSGAQSGRLTLDVSGPNAGETSELALTGPALLAGELRVRLQNGYLPPAGFARTVITGPTRGGTTFDVAFLPGFPDDRFMRVVYGATADADLVSLEVGALAPRLSVPGAQASAAPSSLIDATGGDIDGDGRDDAILITPGNPGTLIILFSRGVDGAGQFLGFWSALSYPIGNTPRGVACAQLDDVPGLDIAVADTDGTLRIFTNNDNWVTTTQGVTGSFTAQPVVSGLGSLQAISAADLNGDGVTDLVLADSVAGAVIVLRGTGGGDFVAQAPLVLGSGASPSSVDIGDLDDDKDLRRPSIIASGGGNITDGAGNPMSRIFVLENATASMGAPVSFAPVVTFDVPGEIRDVAIRNLNPASQDDAFGEVLAVTQRGDEASVVVLRNQESSTGVALSPPVLLPIGVDATSVAAVDLDEDGDPDLGVAARPDGQSDRRVRVLRSEVSQGSQLAFSPAPDLPNPTGASAPALVKAWDISGDGRADLVAIRPTGGSEGMADGGVSLPSIAVRVNRAVQGDANRDGRVDFLDLNIILSDFGQVGAGRRGDVNGDGRVDFFDLNLILSHFGQAVGG